MIARRIFTVALAAAALGAAGFTVSEGQSRDGQNRRVRVHNQTGAVLQTLQAADVRTGTFGSDLLGGTPVAAGSSVPVTIDDGAGAVSTTSGPNWPAARRCCARTSTSAASPTTI